MSGIENPDETVGYSERLRVPLRWWVQGTMLVASFWVALVVSIPGVVPWIVTVVALALLAAGLGSYGSARIRVADGVLHAGRAHIDTSLVGEISALDADQTRRAAGREADARAFLLLRPYLKRAVKVELVDPTDPTPYWLLSSRHPDRLAAALQALADH